MSVPGLDDLVMASCRLLGDDVALLEQSERNELNELLEHWHNTEDGLSLQRELRFKNYYQTTAFINGVFWIAHHEDHHPEILLTYNTCRITYSTHSVGGISLKDFICAAKIENLL